ncbi:protein NLRC3-like [Clarias gariepinus]|uniref:protein NLRC3-like n=1 Tax=Clarias gariepinus TaxID=13013 RepID=UPI00234D9CC2|nr:protein NLRC3-like [Clarias gariepinus]
MDNPDRDKDISRLLEERKFYGNRPESPSPSGVSIKSVRSMEPPENFSGGVSSPLHRNDPAIKEFQKNFKLNLMKKFQHLNGVIMNLGTQTLLNEIYTELYITEGDSGDVNKEHEVRQIEAASRRTTTEETPIQCNDIFKPLSEQDKPIRTVLTKGVAGIGKTVSVQKFILDWAEGKTNQDVHLIFPLPFRELNLMKDQKLSLIELLRVFFKETKETKMYSLVNVLFIFDGLDECRFPLDFQNTVSVCDVTESVSVPVLLINLIKGNLLPSALIWITSRPAAADQIPSECVHRVTEVRGFNDPQKKEYFRKRISDQSLANNIITHLKSLRSLYIMCHIPVFCWISAAVLERMLCEAESGEIPKTLTQMYTHFLIIQINITRKKYSKKQMRSDEEMLLKLGQLAFEQLKKGNLIFYEEDLRECGIDVREAAVYSGVCTQIFREEFGLHQSKVYCFVHLSIQEHLAALYVHLMFMMEKKNVLDQDDENHHLLSHFPMSLGPRAHHRRLWARGRVHPGHGANLSQGTHTYTFIDEIDDMENVSDQWQDDESDDMEILDVHVRAIHQALKSQTGHLDLFLRFLSGLSLESNQDLLQTLVTQTGRSSQSTEETVQYIKMMMISDDFPTEKSVNLIHCLIELGDDSLVEEIQRYLKSGKRSGLSSSQWSALVFVLLTSAQELEEFDLNKYISEDKITGAVLLKVMPVIAASRKSIISCGSVRVNGVSALVSLFSSESSGLREVHLTLETLDLSGNKVEDSVVKDLSVVLANPHFKVENLRLHDCGVSDEGCAALISSLRSNPSHLRDLDLLKNKVGDSAVKCLSALLENRLCKLERLWMINCGVSDEGCAALTSALRSNPSHLRDLDLSYNDVRDSGVKCLSALLENPLCKLETLRLESCDVSDEGCAALTSALRSNPSHLRDLNLSYNHVGDLGVKCLCAVLENPLCKLETLRLQWCGVSDEGCAALTSALRSNPSHLRVLDLSCNNVGDSGVKRLSALKDDEHYKLQTLGLECCGVSDEGCAALNSALRSKLSDLRDLDLSGNKLEDSDVKCLSVLLENPHCKLERLNGVSDEGCAALSSALRSNPSHLRDLDLSYNNVGDSGVKCLSALLQNPLCKLETLRLYNCGVSVKGCAALTSALRSNPSHLRDLDLSWNNVGDSGVKRLSALLQNPLCKLETLRISCGSVGVNGVSALVSLFSSESSGLREVHLTLETLDLSRNKVEDSVVKDLSVVLANPHFKVENLRMIGCGVSDEGCAALTSALRSNPSHLRDLDLSYSHVGDSGVKRLSALLENPLCKLETLRLQWCDVSDEGCASLTSALRSNPSHLRDLDLSYNNVGDSGVKRLSALKDDEHYKLQTLTWHD